MFAKGPRWKELTAAQMCPNCLNIAVYRSLPTALSRSELAALVTVQPARRQPQILS